MDGRHAGSVRRPFEVDDLVRREAARFPEVRRIFRRKIIVSILYIHVSGVDDRWSIGCVHTRLVMHSFGQRTHAAQEQTGSPTARGCKKEQVMCVASQVGKKLQREEGSTRFWGLMREPRGMGNRGAGISWCLSVASDWPMNCACILHSMP